MRAQIARAAPIGAPAAPSGDPGVPVQHRGLGSASEWAKPPAPATGLKKRFRASRGCSQPGVTLGCYWVLLPFVSFFSPSYFCLGGDGSH